MRAHDGGDSRPRIIAHGTRSPTASQPRSAMALSNLSDIAAACKRKRKERDVLISSYESIVSIDEAKKVPKEVKEVWLVAKFGLERIMAARNLINAVPESLTDAQQKEVLSDSYDAACTLMADFHDLLTDSIRTHPCATHQKLLRMWKITRFQP